MCMCPDVIIIEVRSHLSINGVFESVVQIDVYSINVGKAECY